MTKFCHQVRCSQKPVSSDTGSSPLQKGHPFLSTPWQKKVSDIEPSHIKYGSRLPEIWVNFVKSTISSKQPATCIRRQSGRWLVKGLEFHYFSGGRMSKIKEMPIQKKQGFLPKDFDMTLTAKRKFIFRSRKNQIHASSTFCHIQQPHTFFHRHGEEWTEEWLVEKNFCLQKFEQFSSSTTTTWILTNSEVGTCRNTGSVDKPQFSWCWTTLFRNTQVSVDASQVRCSTVRH